MNMRDYVDEVAKEAKLTTEIVRRVIAAQAHTAHQALIAGDAVTIPHLVKLTPKLRAARTCRNPRTGEPVPVPEKRVVTAKPVKALADYVAL